jgi:hypothetical protein
MISQWKDFSTMKKAFYIAGLLSAIGLAVMMLTGLTSIGDILAWKFKLCPWCMRPHAAIEEIRGPSLDCRWKKPVDPA